MFRIFPILGISGMAPFCHLFIKQRHMLILTNR